jgi:hypothetical protein
MQNDTLASDDRDRTIVASHTPEDQARRRTPAENVAHGWLGEPLPSSQAPADALRRRRPYRKTGRGAGIAVTRGYGVRVKVWNHHLVIEDGFGRRRRTRKFHRTDKLRRLLMIGRSGYVTFDALRWLHDTGAAFVHWTRTER